MGSVLRLLSYYKNWESYLVLNIPINPTITFPLNYFPKDVLKSIQRALNLRKEYYDDCYGWHSKYYLPEKIDYQLYKKDEKCETLFFNCLRFVNTMQDDKEFMEYFSLVYYSFDNIKTLCEQYNYEYKTLLKYLIFLRWYEGYEGYYDAPHDLVDYARMSSSISEFCHNKGKFEKYPHFLKSRHIIVSRNYKYIENDIKTVAFKKCYSGNLCYKNKTYCIIEPQEVNDVLKEASEMHNCVASYVDRIIEGRTLIVFMRSVKEPDESLVTVEIKNGHICQAYQKSNTRITKEQNDFLAEYAKKKNFILDNL